MKIDTLTASGHRHFQSFCADESGATAIEYAIIASGVGAFVAATVYRLGDGVKSFFTTLAGLLPG
jgi:pilus assembly protein Flp/PilA